MAQLLAVGVGEQLHGARHEGAPRLAQLVAEFVADEDEVVPSDDVGQQACTVRLAEATQVR